MRIMAEMMTICFSVCLLIQTNDYVPHLITSVESSPVVGNSFTNSYVGWRDGTFGKFEDWAVKQFGVKEPESDDEAEVPVDISRQRISVLNKTGVGKLYCPLFMNTKLFGRSRGLSRDT